VTRRLSLLWFCLLLVAGAARAGTPITLSTSWAGRLNFTGTVATMRTSDNDHAPCSVVASTKELSATLAGIPAGAKVLSARLYWAGSGSSVDDRVNFQGAEVVADRSYTTGTDIAGYNYFSGVVDVTAQVVAKGKDGNNGNGTYKFSGLTIDSGKTYCDRQGVLGGFSLLVVYTDSSEPFRVMNLYEGFQFVHNSTVTLAIGNFRTPDDVFKASGLLGHVTWEGDDTLSSDTERLLFNGYELSDKVNDSGNQFNSASTINGDTSSYGIDFDAYVIQNKGNRQPFVAGATSATTTYQTGDDLVLLSAEIVAVPNVQTADLKMLMTRVGNLQVGGKATYTATVTNLGPNQEDGPITVTDTMPAGMSQPSGSGTGWSCSTSGQRVTCTYAGPLAVGASLPPITFTATITAAGTYTNTATVTGTEFDNVSFNNTVSDTATTIVTGSGVYVFTDKKCVANLPFGHAQQTCNQVNAPIRMFAGETANIFVTALNSSRVPTPLGATAQNVTLNFSLLCDNPGTHAGRQAMYAGATLPLCTPNGSAAGASGWQAVTLLFPANVPSAVLPNGSDTAFSYEDAGGVTLNLVDSAGNPASAAIIAQPALLDFSRIWRPRGDVGNPKATDGTGPGFAMAGEDISISIRACTRAFDASGNAICGRPLPNFGNEGQGVTIAQEKSVPPDPAQPYQPDLVLGNLGAAVNGIFTFTGAHYDEVGVLKLIPMLQGGSYLGGDNVKINVPQTVGRFFPAYFTTEITRPFDCPTKITCPVVLSAAGDNLMQGAAYSEQPFDITVKAFNKLGIQLRNYAGAFARDIHLSPVVSPGGASIVTIPPVGLTPVQIDVGNVRPSTSTKVAFKLPVAYSNAAAPSVKVSGPTPFFLRATSDEKLASGIVETISSQRVTDSSEQGITVIAGRLQVANAFGSELLKLPVPMKAQYWTGTVWQNNTSDNASTIAHTPLSASYSKCTRRLAKDTAGNCTVALTLLDRPAATLKDGIGTLWLAPPGNGNVGSGLLDLTSKGSPPFLPSTLARVTFGIYQSPLIYIREVY
jgi:uncharacterized repeat protein (TIGR01451 family)